MFQDEGFVHVQELKRGAFLIDKFFKGKLPQWTKVHLKTFESFYKFKQIMLYALRVLLFILPCKKT